MPELPEVETIARGLQEQITGDSIESLVILRSQPMLSQDPDVFETALLGRRFCNVSRRAKYLIFELEPQAYLVSHLRMTGKWVVAPEANESASNRMIFHLKSHRKLIYQDIRCLGKLEVVSSLKNIPALERLGIEPLSSDLTEEVLAHLLRQSVRPIKPFLMDPQKIVGIGNIYASEILFRTKIDPRRSTQQISFEEQRRLFKVIRDVLQEAIEQNGTSISDFRQVDDKKGSFQNFLQVYGKAHQACPLCEEPILRIVQSQRSSFYCPHCQT